jgi:hypothetical protein
MNQKIIKVTNGVTTVNGRTFLEYMNAFRGKLIYDKNDREVPKFILFWKGISPTEVKNTHTLIDRI